MNCEYRVVGYYSIRVRLYKIILLYVHGVYGRMTCHSNIKSVLQKKFREKIERFYKVTGAMQRLISVEINIIISY